MVYCDTQLGWAVPVKAHVKCSINNSVVYLPVFVRIVHSVPRRSVMDTITWCLLATLGENGMKESGQNIQTGIMDVLRISGALTMRKTEKGWWSWLFGQRWWLCEQPADNGEQDKYVKSRYAFWVCQITLLPFHWCNYLFCAETPDFNILRLFCSGKWVYYWSQERFTLDRKSCRRCGVLGAGAASETTCSALRTRHWLPACSSIWYHGCWTCMEK